MARKLLLLGIVMLLLTSMVLATDFTQYNKGHWDFGNSPNATYALQDSSLENNDMTNSGATFYAATGYGTDGVNDKIYDGDKELVTTQFTIAVAFKCTDLIQYGTLFGKWHTSASYIVAGDWGNTDKLECRINNAAASSVVSNSALNDNKWRIAVITFNSSAGANQVKMYINGTLQTDTGTYAAAVANGTDRISIGAQVKSDLTSTGYAKCNFSYVSIWNYTFTQALVTELQSKGIKYNPFVYASFTAHDANTAAAINQFSVEVQNGSTTRTYHATTGSILSTLTGTNLTKFKYNVTFYNNSLYVNRTYSNYNFTLSGMTLDGDLVPDNSVHITTYYENSTRIYQNFSARFTSAIPSDETRTVVNGSSLLSPFTSANYTIQIWNTNFNPRYYYVNILNGTTTNLSVFFPTNASSNIKFTVKSTAGIPINNASVTFTRAINISWLTVGQATSDSAGVFWFDMEDYAQYKLLITAVGYETKQVNINAVPSITEYNLVLQSGIYFNFTTIWDLASYTISPSNSTLTDKWNETFNLTASSPGSLLQWFGIYYNATNTDNVTASPAGGSAIVYINTSAILNGTTYKSFLVKFYIKVQNNSLVRINRYYYVYDNTSANETYRNATVTRGIEDLGGGLGSADKILMAVLFTVLFALVTSLALPEDDFQGKKTLVALPLVMGIAFFTAIGWIPLVMGIIVGILMLLNMFPGAQS